MIPNWYNHLKDPEQVKQFKRFIYGSRTILDRELEMLKEMEKELDRTETDPSSYDSPSWAARQAHKNGFRECLNKIQRLITLDQKENNG